jgi:hypothetical protein
MKKSFIVKQQEHNYMNIQIENKQKRMYNAPQIGRIKLDNEISLALESEPPTYESSSLIKAPEYFNNNPFKSDNC